MIILLNWETAAMCLKFLVTQPKSDQRQVDFLYYVSYQEALDLLYAG